LKIIQHAKASLPTLAAGSLLGLEQSSNLEVTNCYAFPARDDEGAAEEAAEYQLEMMKMLREVRFPSMLSWPGLGSRSIDDPG
jgi:translation initiation factor 3 subunit H